MKRQAPPDWFGCGRVITQQSWDHFLTAQKEYWAKKDGPGIAEATPLLPEIIADGVVPPADRAEWAPYLCERADWHFRRTPSFRERMMHADTPDSLRAFMEHWYKAGPRSKQRWYDFHPNDPLL